MLDYYKMGREKKKKKGERLRCRWLRSDVSSMRERSKIIVFLPGTDWMVMERTAMAATKAVRKRVEIMMVSDGGYIVVGFLLSDEGIDTVVSGSGR